MMTHPISLLFFLHITITVVCTTSLTYIDSAAYIPNNFTNVSLYTGTYNQCMCFAFFSNTSPTYQAFNFYANNNTCLLFTSFLSKAYIFINIFSNLTFLQLPSNTTAVTLPTSMVLSTVANAGSLTTAGYFNDSRESAATGTYWGCCKASCGWAGKASVSSPVETCALDGHTAVDPGTASVCDSGSAYACTAQQPWSINDTFSYGYAGASILNQEESDWCCSCYSLVFTSAPIAGKELVVQVITDAGTSDDMFVLQIPGGGWTGTPNGCASQFSGSYSWGNQNGGITSRSDCANLPSVIQAGCYWRFDWLMNTVNPSVQFKVVSCPTALTANTGCVRN